MSLAWIETEESVRQAGLKGYLGPGCSPQQIVEAINTVSNGGFIYYPGDDCGIRVGFLTERQVQVLKMVGKGLTDQEIARQLGVLPTTVRHHLDTLHRKLKLPRRGELIALATLGGLTKPEGSPKTPIQKRLSQAPAENPESWVLAK
ncbi:MAG: helix-turn-helix transcriptional regulator [Armatimonadota bacterium]